MRNPSSGLYECDYYAWLQEQVRALRERHIENVDWENIAEEIEDLGKGERRAVESQLARLIEHLLNFNTRAGYFAIIMSEDGREVLKLRDLPSRSY